MKLTIIIEGPSVDILKIAKMLSDGGAEEALRPREFDAVNKFLDFDYSKCFDAWGYDPKRDGSDLVVTAKVKIEL